MGFWLFMTVSNLILPVLMIVMVVSILLTERALAKQFDGGIWHRRRDTLRLHSFACLSAVFVRREAVAFFEDTVKETAVGHAKLIHDGGDIFVGLDQHPGGFPQEKESAVFQQTHADRLIDNPI